MPFQALPIALRSNTGSPITKLLWIGIVSNARLDNAPNGRAWIQCEWMEIARWAQCSVEEVKAAFEHLERLRLIMCVPGGGDDEVFIDVELPISELRIHERKRVKASPDQIAILAEKAGWRCVACGTEDYDPALWDVDHIIPRSIGGSDVEENLQILCGKCNSRKGAKVHWVDYLK